jgi:hypothetical protein
MYMLGSGTKGGLKRVFCWLIVELKVKFVFVAYRRRGNSLSERIRNTDIRLTGIVIK